VVNDVGAIAIQKPVHHPSKSAVNKGEEGSAIGFRGESAIICMCIDRFKCRNFRVLAGIGGLLMR
jgi:hypothetical protein